MNFTRRAVNGRGNVVGGGFCLALGAVLGIRLFQRILDRGEEHILAQILLLAQRADGFHEFFVLWICLRRSSCLGLSHDCVTLQSFMLFLMRKLLPQLVSFPMKIAFLRGIGSPGYSSTKSTSSTPSMSTTGFTSEAALRANRFSSPAMVSTMSCASKSDRMPVKTF